MRKILVVKLKWLVLPPLAIYTPNVQKKKRRKTTRYFVTTWRERERLRFYTFSAAAVPLNDIHVHSPGWTMSHRGRESFICKQDSAVPPARASATVVKRQGVWPAKANNDILSFIYPTW